jgi:hypothetical protein
VKPELPRLEALPTDFEIHQLHDLVHIELDDTVPTPDDLLKSLIALDGKFTRVLREVGHKAVPDSTRTHLRKMIVITADRFSQMAKNKTLTSSIRVRCQAEVDEYDRLDQSAALPRGWQLAEDEVRAILSEAHE